jgi:hypothetical protein
MSDAERLQLQSTITCPLCGCKKSETMTVIPVWCCTSARGAMRPFVLRLGIVVCSVPSEPHRVLRFSRCAKGFKSRPYLTDRSWSPPKQGVSDCRTKGKGERNE